MRAQAVAALLTIGVRQLARTKPTVVIRVSAAARGANRKALTKSTSKLNTMSGWRPSDHGSGSRYDSYRGAWPDPSDRGNDYANGYENRDRDRGYSSSSRRYRSRSRSPDDWRDSRRAGDRYGPPPGLEQDRRGAMPLGPRAGLPPRPLPRFNRYDHDDGYRHQARDYAPPQSEFSFRFDKPAGVGESTTFAGPPHSWNRPSRGRGAGRGAYRGAGSRRHYAADRRMLTEAPDTNEVIMGVDSTRSKFRAVEDLSDDQEAEMDMSDGDKSSASSSSSKKSKKNKRKKRKVAEISEPVDNVPKWSNPDPYTQLPPTTEDQTKKKTSVLDIIRKARIDAEKDKTVTARVEDYISFDDNDDNMSAKNSAALRSTNGQPKEGQSPNGKSRKEPMGRGRSPSKVSSANDSSVQATPRQISINAEGQAEAESPTKAEPRRTPSKESVDRVKPKLPRAMTPPFADDKSSAVNETSNGISNTRVEVMPERPKSRDQSSGSPNNAMSRRKGSKSPERDNKSLDRKSKSPERKVWSERADIWRKSRAATLGLGYDSQSAASERLRDSERANDPLGSRKRNIDDELKPPTYMKPKMGNGRPGAVKFGHVSPEWVTTSGEVDCPWADTKDIDHSDVKSW